MAYLTEKKFDFRSSALPADKFGVVNFKGFEGFSKPYEFEIMLVSSDPDIDLTEVLQNPAVFTIVRQDGDIPFQGILASFELLHAVDEHVFYRALLVPKFWWLSLTHHNQIFLDKTISEVIEEVLQDGGLTTNDYELRLQNDYPKWEFICQYRESHLNFVSRWMEREGMYYFFEQTDNGEKQVITDTAMSHTPMAEGKTVYYSPPSGLEEAHREEVVSTIICRQELLPKKLYVNDYNYRKPSLNLSAEAEVSSRGRGEVHVYGEHFRTPQEGSALAKMRAEELLSHEKRFHGESSIPFLRPGFLFELQDHFRANLNQQYLTVELAHEGNQTGFLVAGIQKGLAEVEAQPYYRNSFVAIPGDVQYRHPKKAEKPHFYGTINARIDAEGSGQYAELDDQGRYKVRLPFDVSGRKDGRSSHWLRMAQPYAGENQGMHFPLHKHTEVLLTFVEGDPDRPIIAGALPNPESPSPISSSNQTKSIINTGAGPQTRSVGAEYVRTRTRARRPTGNYIEFEDQTGEQHILVYSPTEESWLRLGHPGNDLEGTVDSGIKMATLGSYYEKVGTEIEEFQMTDTSIINIRKELELEKAEQEEDLSMITHADKRQEKQDSIITNAEIDTVCGIVENGEIATPGNLDSSIIYDSKKDFIDAISASGIGNGVTNWVAKEDYIKLIILQNIENSLSKKRRFDVTGDQINKTTGTLRIEAVIPGQTQTEDASPSTPADDAPAPPTNLNIVDTQGDESEGPKSLKIDMTDGGIIIDAGTEDITVKCNHFYIKNTSEDNITYGDDYYEHHGSAKDYFYGDKYEEHWGTAKGEFHGDKFEEHWGDATEKFHGKKHDYHYGNMEEHFEGDKLSVHHGTSGDWYYWHKIEGFLGLNESLALANTFELYGGFKEEIDLAGAVAVGMGFAADIKLGFTADINNSVCVKETKALDWGNTGGLRGESRKMRFCTGLLSVIGGRFCFNNWNLKID